ncbi:MAG: peptidase domain-containing ABC transporter, partial [Burkholderiales bacterium]
MQNKAVTAEDFGWLVGSLCQINRIPFDPSLLFQKYPAPHSGRQLVEALRSFGFRTGDGSLEKSAYPCVGFVAGESLKPALLLKRDVERLLYFVAGTQTPQTAPAASLKDTFAPEVLLVRHELAEAPERDGAPVVSKFGFRWFWTEMLKHKRIWRDVLLASFFIQLIGLTTPLGTQVVIDKVVVHQTD